MITRNRLLLRLLKPFASRLRDYMNAPVYDAVVKLFLPPPVPSSPLEINFLLHESRGGYLRDMQPSADTLLSAGCSGLWYFEWIRRTYGPVRRHIGIEYYSPKPDGLPPEVEWIANTVSDMAGVSDAECDLVFSGQNLEHLWPEEVAGFLAEAARVTKPGGQLVIDSPNRLLTAPLNWSHPEHTVELTVDEATELVRMAGFDVTKVVGIWLCRDPRTGRILSFDPNVVDPEWTVIERVLAARDNPQDSFIWWIEANRNSHPADVAGLNARMQVIFAAAWPERTRRMLVAAGTMVDRDGEDWVIAAAGHGGAVTYGPFMPLKPGRYRVSFTVDVPAGNANSVGRCEVITGDSNASSVGSTDIPFEFIAKGPRILSVEFGLNRLEFGMQFRCISNGQASFAVRRTVEILSLDLPPA